MKKLLAAALLSAGTIIGTSPAYAILVTESVGSRSASGNFVVSGVNTLSITLTNTGADVQAPGDVLTAVFFNLPAGLTLTPLTNTSMTGNAIYGAIANAGNGYEYRTGLVGAPNGTTSGISTAGFGLFGPNGNLGPNPIIVNGLDYGLVTVNDNAGNDNGGVVNGGPLIRGTVTFNLTMSGTVLTQQTADAFFGVDANVNFQFGTALTEPDSNTDTTPPRVPDSGSTLILGGIALTVLGLGRRFWNRK